jgi:hypothetical protein
MRFRAELRSTGGNTAGFQVDDDVVAALDGGGRPKVVVTVNGFEWRRAALDAEPAAKAFWDGLSYSNKSWHVLQVTGAKAAETRARRVARSVAMLLEGRAR